MTNSIRKLVRADRSHLAEILAATAEFTPDEAEVALELIDSALEGGSDYEVLVAETAAVPTGYICFGHTAMTQGTYDLYWVCVRPSDKGKGIGRALVAAMEAELTKRGALLVRVETEGSDAYDATRAFYDSIGYERAAVFADFYRPGVDLVTYRKVVAKAAR
ncbi:MAG: GNAT family N-acetyltransferase [Myxococcales bacterium]|nr:GNAT family N-acetyltransferase [Myxococcales bacterium]